MKALSSASGSRVRIPVPVPPWHDPEKSDAAARELERLLGLAGEWLLDVPLHSGKFKGPSLREIFEGFDSPPPTSGEQAPPIQQPGFPSEPPPDPEEDQPLDPPLHERLGDLLENIPPEIPFEFERYPQIEEGMRTIGMIVEWRRGSEQTKDDLDTFKDFLLEWLPEILPIGEWRHVGGARTRDPETGELISVKETSYPNANPIEGRSKMNGGSFSDITIVNDELGYVVVVEHQSMLASGVPTKRESDAAARLERNAAAAEAKERRRIVLMEGPKRGKNEKSVDYDKRLMDHVKNRYADLHQRVKPE